MKKKRIRRIQEWLAELGPQGRAVGKLVAHMNDLKKEGVTLSPEDTQGGLSMLSTLEVLEDLGQLGPEAAAMAGMLRRMYLAPARANMILPQSDLASLLVRLALDQDFLESFLGDPSSAPGLTEEDRQLLQDEDSMAILRAVAPQLGWAVVAYSPARQQGMGGDGYEP